MCGPDAPPHGEDRAPVAAPEAPARMTPLAYVLSLPIRAYRLTFSSYVGFNCRYDPTCSAYAMEALRRHGGIKGGWLTFRRVLRCHPWGGFGVDDVPK